ncbi:hypothetical protein DL96DRAFT_1583183 [Flagelloscypha sp. PMI_526]|nr:hypothetical protein DL96DRAFT_1583183 [Flagelloscypha sp. PMI_526]
MLIVPVLAPGWTSYETLYNHLSKPEGGPPPSFLISYLEPRKTVFLQSLKNQPFGSPNPESKKAVESGSVTLPDGVKYTVQAEDKPWIIGISSHFHLDEIHAFILLRGFLYNEGIPTSLAQGEGNDTEDCMIPLFRSWDSADGSPIQEVAEQFLKGFVASEEHSVLPLPSFADESVDGAKRAAKQILQESLHLLELVFWALWSWCQSSSTLPVAVFETLYATSMGREDDESNQIKDDTSVLWILIALEVLELELLLEHAADPHTPLLSSSMILSHESSEFSLLWIAWAVVLLHVASQRDIPPSHQVLMQRIAPHGDLLGRRMLTSVLAPDAGALELLLNMLNNSPIFGVRSAGSSVTDSIIKGFLVALVSSTVPETVPGLNTLFEVWISLFGNTKDSASVVQLCTQFWDSDKDKPSALPSAPSTSNRRHGVVPISSIGGSSRSALFDVARARFPVMVRPLVRLLPCAEKAFDLLQHMGTYTTVVRSRFPMDGNKAQTPLPVPGNTTIDAGTKGSLISGGDSEDFKIVIWNHSYSGWGVVLAVLREFVAEAHQDGLYQGYAPSRQNGVLSLREIGFGMSGEEDLEATVVDCLDLIRAVLLDHDSVAQRLAATFDDHSSQQTDGLDLVGITCAIVEISFAKLHARQWSTGKTGPNDATLVTSSLSVLESLVAIEAYRDRVWLYLSEGNRSTSSSEFVKTVLASERLRGEYPALLTLLRLVDYLFYDASSTLRLPPDNQHLSREMIKMREVKESVLLRAAHFVMQKFGWIIWAGNIPPSANVSKLALGIVGIWSDVLEGFSPLQDGPRGFEGLSNCVVELFLWNASSLSINPLTYHIATCTLHSHRFLPSSSSDQLATHLHFIRMLLNVKRQSPGPRSTQGCLLEHALCSPIQTQPIDLMANYVRARDMGPTVQMEAANVLYTLCLSLATISPRSHQNISSHFGSFVRILNALWNFVTLAVDKEPTLARLFVSGDYDAPEKEETVLDNWETLWSTNPELLVDAIQFIRDTLDPLCSGSVPFLDILLQVVRSELGPMPEYDTAGFTIHDHLKHSGYHHIVAAYSQRTLVKAEALRILSLALALLGPSEAGKIVDIVDNFVSSEDEFGEVVAEAAASAYDPELQETAEAVLREVYPGLSLEQIRLRDPLDQRKFGDRYAFSLPLLDIPDEDDNETLEKLIMSINLNQSLTFTQRQLSEALQLLLGQLRARLLSLAASESREGQIMSVIHSTRLSLLLSLLELMWFEPTPKAADLSSFPELLQNPPSASVLRQVITPFHKTAIYLARQPKLLHAKDRIEIHGFADSAIQFLLDSLAVTLDLELDQDMELIVAAFEQCANGNICSSSNNDLIRLSLELFTKTDVSGFQEPSILLVRKRTSGEGLLPAYSNNSMTPAVNAGLIDIRVAELPGERSPPHAIWTAMLSVAASVIGAVGRQSHYFDSTACAFVQLYQDQLIRALSWTNNDVITFPLLEEIEQVVNLFAAIAEAAPRSASPSAAVAKVLEIFTDKALDLLQQFNYALTHPNHLATLLEPVTAAERAIFDKESSSTDLTKNTLVVKLIHNVYQITSAILFTLTTISRAEQVLLGDENDWDVSQARVLSQSKVVVGEPASQGTLVELGNVTITMLRDLSDRQPSQSLLPVSASPSFDPLSAQDGLRTAQACLEAVLLYSVTQLVMSLTRPEAPNTALKDLTTDENTDDMVLENTSLSTSTIVERRKPRTSLADRIRRGMPGEVTAEVQALLAKAVPVLKKCNQLRGGQSKDIAEILKRFLSERAGTGGGL